MRRLLMLMLLAGLSLACVAPASAQIFMGPGSQQRAEKAAKKEEKARAKQGKKQLKAMRKSEKAQQKAAKRKR
jgi:hypothetical protein